MNKLLLLSLVLSLAACDNGFKTKPLAGNTGQGTPTPTPTPTGPPPNPGTPCGDARVSWTNPTTMTDGSRIVDPLLRNSVHYGFASRTYSNEVLISNPPAQGSYRFINLEVGRSYYFSVKAVAADGSVSDFSNEAIKVITWCAPPLIQTTDLDEVVIDVKALEGIPFYELDAKDIKMPNFTIGVDDVPEIQSSNQSVE